MVINTCLSIITVSKNPSKQSRNTILGIEIICRVVSWEGGMGEKVQGLRSISR